MGDPVVVHIGVTNFDQQITSPRDTTPASLAGQGTLTVPVDQGFLDDIVGVSWSSIVAIQFDPGAA